MWGLLLPVSLLGLVGPASVVYLCNTSGDQHQGEGCRLVSFFLLTNSLSHRAGFDVGWLCCSCRF